MFRNFFKTSLRNLWKNRSFTAINLIGLTLGLSSVMALSIMVYQFLTLDHDLAGKSRMAYLKTHAKDGGEYKQTTYPLLYEALRTCSDIEAGTHLQTWFNPWLKYQEKEIQERRCFFVDTGFFSVFAFPFKYGDAGNALHEKNSIVLSEETAEKLFGKENPVGKVIAADDTVLLTVTGVMKHLLNNTSIRPDILLTSTLLKDNPEFAQAANWYNGFAENYLKLKKGADIKRLEGQLDQLVQIHYVKERRSDKIKVVSFDQLMSDNMGPIGNAIISGSTGTIIFILLIIIVNLVNLNAGTMFARAREVAVRRMIGSGKRSIIMQFCIENGLVIFSSLILAFIFFRQLLIPQMNQLFGEQFGQIELDLSRDYPLILLFIALGLLVAFAAASYPAWHLTSLKVTDTIKGKLSGGGRKSVTRSIFITLQFVLSISLIYTTIILSRQMNHMKTASLGFNKEDVVVVNLDLAYKNPKAAEARFDALLNSLRSNTRIKSFSTSSDIPTAYSWNYNQYMDAANNKEINMRQVGADAAYFSTYEIPFIEGRAFDNVAAANEHGHLIINRAAMKAFGWTSAVGKQIKEKGNNEAYTVIGVTEDFNYGSLAGQVEPLLHWYAGKQSINNNYLSIAVRPGQEGTVIRQVQEEFKSMPSRREFGYEMMTDKVDKQYSMLNNILLMTRYVSFLTIFIACMGMLGLVSLYAKQRVKEIGVRKVLGAGVPGIVRLLSTNYLLLAAVASVIAAPLSWMVMSNWLRNFAYRISIEWWMLALGAFSAVAIVFITISFQTIRAARANPVKSLRTE